MRVTSKRNGKWMRTAKFPLVCMIVFALSLQGLEAQTPKMREFSLQAVQEYAVQHSYDSRKSQLDIMTAQKQLRETVASGLPQIESVIGYTNNLELTTVLIPNFFEGEFDEKIPVQFGTKHNANVDFQVNQLIFSGSYFVGLQTSKIFRRLADENHTRTQLNVLETVTNTYTLILVTEESERILAANLVNLEKTLYEVTERHKEGFVAETDVDLVNIAVTKLKNGLQAIQRQKGVAYKLLNFQMGLDLNERLVLTDKLEDILQRIDPQKLNTKEPFDLDGNIDYQVLKTQEKLSEMAMKNEKMKYWPTITAFYTFQWNAFRDAFNFFSAKERWFRTQMLGVNVNIPIFKSGAQKARVQKATIALKQAQTAREQAAEGLALDAARTRADLESAYDNYVNTRENMRLSKKVYDVTLIKYKEGVASSMDLTQAHDQYLTAQSEFIQAMSGLLVVKNKLDRLNSNSPDLFIKSGPATSARE